MKIRNQAYLDAFGANLKKLIVLKKKTPEDVAAIGRIETKQVYRVINGEHSATLSVIVAIAKGLEIHPKKLLDFEFDFGE
ncbi:MAG TPA: helix-turn-helix domain-containing protein [Chitinophagaceae bacterium]|nr:helix-turn-helix domain-containing protein [Chitinophagaceae bacterium]HMU57270.1 helix-turn-helix domain-containing protein [Chitinophagaceae bacterium]